MANKISDEDKKLFREAMEELKREETVKSQIKTQLTKANSSWKYQLSDAYYDEVGPETILSFCASGLPKRRFQELKLGQIPWESKLDLHGVRYEDAADALCHSIEYASLLHQRMVLIIHGKGGKSGNKPILKNYVNHWLKQLPQVLAFHSAIPRDGGAGALYVLLRKNPDKNQ